MNPDQPRPYGIRLSVWFTLPVPVIAVAWLASGVVIANAAATETVRPEPAHTVWVVITVLGVVYAPIWFWGVLIAENVL